VAFTYTCAQCGGTFESDRSPGEADAEAKRLFGADVLVKDCDVICDVCFKAIFGETPSIH